MSELHDEYTQEGEPEGEAPDDRPEFLPPQFETPEALVQSYQHAQQKISQQGQELAELRSRLSDLEELAEAFEPSSEPQRYEEVDEEPLQAYESPTPAPDYSEALAVLQAAAERAGQSAALRVLDAARPGTQAQAGAPGDVDTLAYQVESYAAQRFPDWHETRGQVVDLLQRLPYLVPDNLSLPDVQRGVDQAYAIVKTASSAAFNAEEGRRQKLAAQTMSGAAGRMPAPSDDEQHFERMKAEHRKGYAQRMSGL